ncbi:alpha/beta fold hydrolase [Nonomuraea sp. KC401]|nr:alpha/beta fold hydrolase [Nonomuraea sp. K271]TLF64985.1 alpha/beta fold hydrolase [Nonomuraea sp. KC401]
MIDGPAGRLAVTDHGGHGPDVVLIHGANRSPLDWEPLRRHLPGARLVAYDLRGHGRSDAPADARRRAAQTAALVAGPAVLTGEQVEAMCRRLTGRQQIALMS